MRKWCRKSRSVATIASTLNRKVSPATLAEYLPEFPASTTLAPDVDDVSVDRFVNTSHGANIVFKRVAKVDEIDGNGKQLSCVVAAGDCIYTATENEICIWNHGEKHPALRITVNSPVKALAVFGNRIFSAHRDNKVRVWETTTNLKNTDINYNYKLAATLPRMRQRVVSSLWADNYVQVRRHHKKLWLQHADVVSALAVSETNGLLYTASWDKTVKVWRLSDLRCVESITAHHDAVNALLVVNGNNDNINSERLYTASSDGSVKVWMREDGKNKSKHSLVGSIEGGHARSASVNAIAYTNRPELLLWSAGSDGAILGWRTKNRKESDTAEYEISAVNLASGGATGGAVVSLRSNGDILFSVNSLEKAVRVWRVVDRTNVNARRSPYDYEVCCVSVLGGGPGAAVRSLFLDSGAGVLYSGGWDRITVHAYSYNLIGKADGVRGGGSRNFKVKPTNPDTSRRVPLPYSPI